MIGTILDKRIIPPDEKADGRSKICAYAHISRLSSPLNSNRPGFEIWPCTLSDTFVIPWFVQAKHVAVDGRSDALPTIEAHKIESKVAQGCEDAVVAADAGSGVLAEALIESVAAQFSALKLAVNR